MATELEVRVMKRQVLNSCYLSFLFDRMVVTLVGIFVLNLIFMFLSPFSSDLDGPGEVGWEHALLTVGNLDSHQPALLLKNKQKQIVILKKNYLCLIQNFNYCYRFKLFKSQFSMLLNLF